MKKLLLAAAIVAGSCSLVMAQGTGTGGGAGTSGAEASGGQGPSSAPTAQQPRRKQMSSDRQVGMPRTVKKKKKKMM